MDATASTRARRSSCSGHTSTFNHSTSSLFAYDSGFRSMPARQTTSGMLVGTALAGWISQRRRTALGPSRGSSERTAAPSAST
jgi:hypothetical protein